MRKEKIGLALGAGAFRGFAHIGVLEVLEGEGIPIDIVAGTSIGSLIGALYVSGMSVAEMLRRAEKFSEMSLYDLTVPRRGLLAGRKLQAFVEELTGGKTFAESRLPFAAVACDFETMEMVVIQEGPLHEAVRASTSIPAVFVPLEKDGRTLVDGGVLGRVPADVCRQLGADIVIGVDVGYRGQRVKPTNIIESVMHTIDMFEWQLAQRHISEADLMITPDVLDINPARIGGRAMECVDRGRKAAIAALPDILGLVGKAERALG